MLYKILGLPLSLRPSSARHRRSSQRPLPDRHGGVAYALAVLIVLAASILYAVAIMLGVGVPSLRSYPLSLSTRTAVIIDLALLLLASMHFHFVQRPYATLNEQQLGRSPATCTQDRLLVSALLLGFFFAWQPLADAAWALSAPSQLLLMQFGTYVGWISLLASVALLEMPAFLRFVLRVRLFSGTASAARVARAGIVCGLLLVEWCAAQMNVGHLLFAGALTAYLTVTLWLYRRSVNVDDWRSGAMNMALCQPQG